MSSESPYRMTLSLNVLNHLGLNLYSNVPSVLSEVVANAWDADAENVWITIDSTTGNERIVIRDDGHGMTPREINERYLLVGYERRKDKPGPTEKFGRYPMGRKGIGKLSLFSIAKTIEVRTVKDNQRSAFRMQLDEIRKKIGEQEAIYEPEVLSTEDIDFERGTQITITDPKKRIYQAASALRTRLARRFSIIGPTYNFAVSINDEDVSHSDRDYYHKVQYLWTFGDEEGSYKELCTEVESMENLPGRLDSDDEVQGWIGTVEESGKLKDQHGDNLNRIVVLVRGKVAQEDILEEFGETGIFSSYLIGEVHADFLDADERDDIATSSRQRIIEDDPRYEALKAFIGKTLKKIQNEWTRLRNEKGSKKALEIPAIDEWFKELGRDQKGKAKSLFGKINTLTIENPDDKKRLLKQGVIAFETLRYKEKLDALEAVSTDNLEAVMDIFSELDDIEATLYHQIIRERIEVIRTLRKKVHEDNALEKVIQQHIFEHLWLLDPSWERAATSEYMEQQVRTEFGKIEAGLTEEEKLARLDLGYRTASGKHILVELKRADRRVGVYELAAQINKYKEAIVKLLKAQERDHEPFEFVCIIGADIKEWGQTDGRKLVEDTLRPLNARVVMYPELLRQAHDSYKAFMEQHERAGRINRLLDAIDKS
uniref:Histidine kinase-, DNA gyrase B-, and HSP90-like ATPase n=1 Tax=Candidatus Kentrum sp. UNK TaxID=2126344 RepID=A0A451AS79_9GAMM|nr:MAG: Histidine kinase-, DNA gyrase B-, and HSP90-like ATPase [Candidatus Kentron sp. UNK]VFK68855.1 MAG: Histidine kinase-, DNA gyrase B-, and HSP90-like ATPase [Candidatus Kentron sp. UNK]